MSEEDAALFWSVDILTDPVSGETSTGQIMESTEATPASRLWPKTTTLPEPAMGPNVPTIQCSMRKTASTETAQDTKPAMQSQATNTVSVDESSGEKTAIPMPCQITTGTQTESGSSLLEAETLTLKEALSEEISSNTPIVTMSSGQFQPKDMRERRKRRRRDNPETLTKDAHVAPNLWAVLPFAQATWRSAHRLRAVTSAKDVDPRVLEVLDLPILNLAAAQEEDPDLQLVKELL